MFSLTKIRNITALSLILFVNLIFVYKYTIQYNLIPTAAIPLYILIFLLIIFYLNRKDKSIITKYISKYFLSISLTTIVIWTAFIYLIPREGEIGRLTAIEEWLILFFEGIYPYTSYITPSAFPLFYFLVSPFYFINQLGFLEVLGLAFLLIAIKNASRSSKALSILFLLIFSAPITYFDLIVRSELTFNIGLLILLIIFLNQKTELGKTKFIIFAVFFGITLSTKSVVIVPMIIFLLYYFRNDLKQLFNFGLIILLVFILQLLPFVFWDVELFVQRGPFAIQSHLADLPLWFTIIFILLAVYFGWMVENIHEVFFSSGIILFMMIIASYISKIIEYGFKTAFFGENFIDPSYLAFVIPLLILSIEDYEVDKFLNRKLV